MKMTDRQNRRTWNCRK